MVAEDPVHLVSAGLGELVRGDVLHDLEAVGVRLGHLWEHGGAVAGHGGQAQVGARARAGGATQVDDAKVGLEVLLGASRKGDCEAILALGRDGVVTVNPGEGLGPHERGVDDSHLGHVREARGLVLLTVAELRALLNRIGQGKFDDAPVDLHFGKAQQHRGGLIVDRRTLRRERQIPPERGLDGGGRLAGCVAAEGARQVAVVGLLRRWLFAEVDHIPGDEHGDDEAGEREGGEHGIDRYVAHGQDVEPRRLRERVGHHFVTQARRSCLYRCFV